MYHLDQSIKDVDFKKVIIASADTDLFHMSYLSFQPKNLLWLKRYVSY